jgi:hypothetical protein
MTDQQPGSGQQVTMDEELRQDALDVLADALEWRLEPVRWRVVEEAVRALKAAMSAGDVEAMRAAVYRLELAGPVRAVGVGDTPLVDAVKDVREEINELARTLDWSDADKK